ncbi:Protein-serine/threonine phosphatase/Protein-tyrosine-phosphatase/4-nitrophenylphosphatase [Xylaria longipes]|nr:Protein-serine/threonine phosphatase/Protein-tyrosine-phosphatase/4-nitrophenylphosphatase [Xylaria longipes]
MATTKKADLVTLAGTDVNKALAPEEYGPVISAPPFVFVDGTFNTRDLGLVPESPLRANFAFRSGALGGLTDNGKVVLTGKLGVKRVFDLRSPEERSRMPDPVIDGVENTWIQSSRPDSKPDLNKFVAGEGEVGYEDMYLEVIDVYADSWKAILEHVRDRPQDPFLVHCTGVFGGLLLALAGASEDAIATDWQLSRIGTEPVRAMLLEFARKGTDAYGDDQPGFYNLVSLRKSCWRAFVQALEKQYGGFEKFVTDRLGFSQDDLAKIKKNLTSA